MNLTQLLIWIKIMSNKWLILDIKIYSEWKYTDKHIFNPVIGVYLHDYQIWLDYINWLNLFQHCEILNLYSSFIFNFTLSNFEPCLNKFVFEYKDFILYYFIIINDNLIFDLIIIKNNTIVHCLQKICKKS